MPDRSSTEAIAGAPGPVTTTSLTFVRTGLEKSTTACSSGRTMTWATTQSTLPSVSAEPSRSRGNGTKTTLTLVAFVVFSLLLSCSSNAWPSS